MRYQLSPNIIRRDSRLKYKKVHIEDSEFYDSLYNNNAKWDKYEPYTAQFNSPGSTISTADHDLHRARRKPENNLFSKRNVIALEPIIHKNIRKVCARLEEYKKEQAPFPVNQAMLSFTSDVVSEYAFGKSYDLLDTVDLAPSMLKANKTTGEGSNTLKQWPWLVKVFEVIPISWIAKLSADFGLVLRYQDVCGLVNSETLAYIIADGTPRGSSNPGGFRSGREAQPIHIPHSPN